MRSIKFKIAGYNILFGSSPAGPGLEPSSRFEHYISSDELADVEITVHRGSKSLPEEAERVFHAPYAEEDDGIIKISANDFWSIWQDNNTLYIETIFPRSASQRKGILRFSLRDMKWDMWIDSDLPDVDPLAYPLDGLILYYLTVISSDIMIHASGVNYSGDGFLFCGLSGKGKSTIARLWESYGATVIHDDRLIVRKAGNAYRMYNTPVYNNDSPGHSPLNRIYVIGHGRENKVTLLSGTAAIGAVMANCIQHAWGKEIITRILGSVSGICTAIPVSSLLFSPDRSCIDKILQSRGKEDE